jgi:hypothetical protein
MVSAGVFQEPVAQGLGEPLVKITRFVHALAAQTASAVRFP